MSSLRRMSLWDNSIGLVSMVRVNAILGNLSSPEWAHRAESSELCYIELDGWMAQRSRFVAKSTDGESSLSRWVVMCGCVMAMWWHTMARRGG